MEGTSFRKQAPKNLIMNILSFVVNTLVGLWLVPYLISEIGVAAYGLVPLAMVFTSYIALITVSINGAISRFITIDIQQNEWNNANRTFNTAFFALLFLTVILLPILSIVVFKIDKIINIPTNVLYDAYYLFAFTFLGFLVSLLGGVFGTSMYARNRLDLSQFVEISRVLTRLIIIVLFFIIFRPSLLYVGLANLIAAIVATIISFINWRKLTPQLRLNLKFYDFSKLYQILGMGGWLIVNMVGYLLFLRIDLIIVNKFLGTELAGSYAAVLQWNSLLRTIGGVLSAVIGPMILISYASSKMNDVIRFGKLGVKILAISVAIITGVISGFAADLLGLWLEDEFRQYGLLLIVMLFHLTVNLGVLPLLSINTALNKVKIPGIVSLFMGLANLILALIFVLIFDWGMYGVAIAGGIALTLKNGLFTPWYASRILNIKSNVFFLPLISGIFVYLLSYGISYGVNSFHQVTTWMELIILGSLSAIISCLVAWMFLKSEERKMFISFIPKISR